jgi:hypothetical protein
MLKPKVRGSEIQIIGSRRSGKTTYLASLLRCPKELQRQFPQLSITPITDKAEDLIETAKNIIERGAKLAGGSLDNPPPVYSFQISIPAIKGNTSVTLELNAKDYPGELFDALAEPHRWTTVKPYLEDLWAAQGWMVMLTDWQLERDSRVYEPALKKLLEELIDQAGVKPELRNLRLAVVMTKCERGELWPCRLDPEEDLFKVRLPNTYKLLTRSLPPRRLRFFACSSFGILSDRPGERDPRPNRYIPDDGSSAEFNAYLRDPGAWKPYGLISPIYWLSTGRVFHDERL